MVDMHNTKQTLPFGMVRRIQAFSVVSLLSHSTMAGGSGRENKDCDQNISQNHLNLRVYMVRNVPNSQ